jgi:hypothetical protein
MFSLRMIYIASVIFVKKAVASLNGAPQQPTKIRNGLKHLLDSIEAKKKGFMTRRWHLEADRQC